MCASSRTSGGQAVELRPASGGELGDVQQRQLVVLVAALVVLDHDLSAAGHVAAADVEGRSVSGVRAPSGAISTSCRLPRSSWPASTRPSTSMSRASQLRVSRSRRKRSEEEVTERG